MTDIYITTAKRNITCFRDDMKHKIKKGTKIIRFVSHSSSGTLQQTSCIKHGMSYFKYLKKSSKEDGFTIRVHRVR